MNDSTLLAVGWAFGLLVTWLVLVDANGRDWSGRAIGAMGWGFVTFLFWPVGATLYVIARPRTAPPATHKTCPDCAEQVLAAALVCKHCGHRFSAA